jgi:hypothetical protein
LAILPQILQSPRRWAIGAALVSTQSSSAPIKITSSPLTNPAVVAQAGVVRIADAIPAGGGRVVLLDAQLNRITLWKGQQLLATAGGSGFGPGQLAEPYSLGRIGSSVIGVLDPAARAIAEYEVTNNSLKFKKQFLLGRNGSDFCTFPDRLALLGRGGDNPTRDYPLLYYYSLDGRQTNAFGVPFSNHSPYARIALSFGRVLCDSRSHRLLVVSELYPEIRAYDLSGKLLWTTHLDKLISIQIQEISTREVHISFPPGDAYHAITSLFPVTGDSFGIQICLRTQQQPTECRTLETRVYSIQTGQQLGSQRSLPLVRRAVSGEFVTTSTEPAPAFQLFSYRVSR